MSPVLGTAAVGAYSVGWRIAKVQVDWITALLGHAASAVLTQLPRYHAKATDQKRRYELAKACREDSRGP